MPRFLIELPHDDDRTDCIKALRTIEQYGSHLLTQAEWGCKAGVHCGYLMVELDSRDEALLVVPPEFRRAARIVELNQFTREEMVALAAEIED